MATKRVSRDHRAGWLLRQDNLGSFAKVFGVLKARELQLYHNDARDEDPLIVYDLEGAAVTAPDAARVARRFSMEVAPRSSAGAAVVLCAESKDEQEAWLQALSCAAVPEAWPGGLDLLKRPQPLLYSMWVLKHTPPGRGRAGSAAAATSAPPLAAPSVPSPFPKLPTLKSAPAWQRKSLLLQKLRWCTVVFDGVDPAAAPEEREYKRNTLLEMVDYADAAGRALFGDVRVLEDTFAMVRVGRGVGGGRVGGGGWDACCCSARPHPSGPTHTLSCPLLILPASRPRYACSFG